MDLEYIRRKRDGSYDSGYLSNYEADFDISTDTEYVTNDFEIKMPLPDDEEDMLFIENEVQTIVFVEGTEYGGLISGSVIDIAENEITYTGRTWRGTESEWIIEPPAGQDYLVVSGNLATSIRKLPHSSYMEIEDTSYTGGSFQFNRYITTFEGVTSLLIAANRNYRASIEFVRDDGEYTGKARMTITTTRDLTGVIEVSQDYNDQIQLKIVRDHTTPRHLICLGQGELKDRQVIHLYADEDWNVSQTAIAGAYPVEIYDFSSSDTLLQDGISHFKELIENHEQIDVSISDFDVKLGDIISARDHLSGECVTAEITKIIYHCENNGNYQKETYEYKTKIRR